MVQERAGFDDARLGDDLARLVVPETVDHDPLEPRQGAKGLRRAFAYGLDRGGPFQGAGRGVQAGDQFDPEPGLLRALFYLDDHSVRKLALRVLDDDIVFQPVSGAPAMLLHAI